MLPASELAALQAAALTAFDTTCTLKRATLTPDGTGRATQSLNIISLPTNASGYNCMLAQPSAQLMQQYFGKVGNQKSYLVRVAATASVQENDRISISGYADLVVQAILDRRSYPTALRLFCSVVE